MTITISQLFTPTQLPASVGVLFTMPSSPTSTVLKNGRVRLTNTTGGVVTITLHAAAAASASSDANCFVKTTSISGNAFLDVDLPTLKAGDTLRGFASAATSITMHEMGGVLYS